MRNIKCFFLIFFIAFIGCLKSFSQVFQLPELTARVIDQTETLTKNEVLFLDKKITQFEKEKGSQIVVLIVNSIHEIPIEEYTIKLAEKWKIGREKIDDGIILFVSKQDKKIRLEIGYGLEGTIPDIYAKRIISNIIAPQFRSSDFFEGLNLGIDAIIKLINKEDLPKVNQNNQTNENVFYSIGIFLFLGLLLVLKIGIKNKKIKLILGIALGTVVGFVFLSFLKGIIASIVSLFFLFINGTNNGGGTGGSFGRGGFLGGGGSFGSFGRGGFSGGGGSFGGGGASGGW